MFIIGFVMGAGAGLSCSTLIAYFMNRRFKSLDEW
jgi:hypothetical protein